MTEDSVIQPESTTSTISPISWFFASFALPFGSAGFYKASLKRSTSLAVLMFFTLMSVSTLLQTISFANTLSEARAGITAAYQTGDIPTITIKNGQASVTGGDTHIFVDEQRMLVAIDVSGRITEIDRYKYSQGFLLTRTELHFLNDRGEYQVMSLRDFSAMSTEPIVIDEAQVLEWFTYFFWGMVAMVLIGIWLWIAAVRFMWIVGIGLVVWGITSLIKPGTGFDVILKIGLYAYVPTVIFDYWLGLIGFDIVFVHTTVLGILWAIGLMIALRPSASDEETPYTLSIPQVAMGWLLLFVCALNMISPLPYAAWIVFGMLVITIGFIVFWEFQMRPGTAVVDKTKVTDL